MPQAADLMRSWDGYEACPAHEYRFVGLAERSTSLYDHFADRAEELLEVAGAVPGLSLWQIDRATYSVTRLGKPGGRSG